MSTNDERLKKQILNSIEESNMKLDRKLHLLSLLDRAFRQYLGVISLSDDEIHQNDILSRSM